MDNIIQFPSKEKIAIKDMLQSCEDIYKKAGLSDESISSALGELEPILKDIIKPFQSNMALPGDVGLSQEQADAIADAHNKCVQDIFTHFYQETGAAVRYIAGLIGRQYSE